MWTQAERGFVVPFPSVREAARLTEEPPEVGGTVPSYRKFRILPQGASSHCSRLTCCRSSGSGCSGVLGKSEFEQSPVGCGQAATGRQPPSEFLLQGQGRQLQGSRSVTCPGMWPQRLAFALTCSPYILALRTHPGSCHGPKASLHCLAHLANPFCAPSAPHFLSCPRSLLPGPCAGSSLPGPPSSLLGWSFLHLSSDIHLSAP